MIRFNCPNCNRYYELHPALAHLPLVCKQCGHPFTPPEGEPEPPPPPKPVASPVPKPALPVAEVVAPAPAKPAKSAAKAPAPPVVAVQPPKRPAAPPKAPPPPEDDEDDDGVLVTGPDEGPDIDFNVGGPTAASLSDAARARPAGLSDANRPRPADLDRPPADPSPGEPDPGADINLDRLPPAPAPAPARKRTPKPPAPTAEEPSGKRAEPTLVPFLADFAAFVVLVVLGMILGEMLARKPTGVILSEAGSAPKFPPIDLVLWAAPTVMFALVYLLLNSRQRTLGAWLRRRAAR